MNNTFSKSIDHYVNLLDRDCGDKTKEPYSSSSLSFFFQLDTWCVFEGILLISGISPNEAIIDFDQYNDLGAKEDKVKIKAAQPLNIISDIYDYPRIEDFRKDIEEWESDLYDLRLKLASSPTLTEQEKLSCDINRVKATIEDYEVEINSDDMRNVEFIREHYDEKIGRLLKLWIGTIGHSSIINDQNMAERYPKEYFLNWSRKKGIHIDWLEWAEKEGLLNTLSTEINHDNTTSQSEYENLHITIAQLAKVVAELKLPYKHGDKPNASRIFKKIEQEGLVTRGTGKSIFSDRLKRGLELLDRELNK